MSGLVIINADDWGGSHPTATDAMECCFAAGAITSATAMVWMSDSARAADLAVAHRRPTGLHLNLTYPFEDRGAPAAARERQGELCAFFADLRVRRWTVDPRPRIHRLVRDAITDQLEEYRARYGGDPTHIDGHQHVHVCPDVALALPRGMKVRQTRTGTAPHLRLKQAWLARRFITTSRFCSLYDLDEPTELTQADDTTMEIMCHPSVEFELRRLLDDDWIDTVARVPHGSYVDLG